MRLTMRFLMALLCLSLLFTGQALAADASKYPDKPIQLIVPFSPGGDTDLAARSYAKALQGILGKAVVVVNMGGASGSIGATKVKDSAPDGYTVGFFQPTFMTTMVTGLIPFTYRDFELPGLCAKADGVLIVVRGDSPMKNVKDLVATAKKNPETVKFGINVGGFTHILGTAFERATDTKIKMISVGGVAEHTANILGGHVDIVEGFPVMLQSYLKTGRLRALGIVSDKRSPHAPDVPTFKEQGVDLAMERFYFMVMPKGTPKEIVDKFGAALKKATELEQTKADLDKIGLYPEYMPQEEAYKYLDGQRTFYEQFKDILSSTKKK